jgi:protein-S-isoprenylcysteine O-methyltransferase Ste14
MTSDEFLLRRAVVLGSALIYWVGVSLQARRVRRQIGRAPNLKPRSTKERLLWAGWAVVVGLWLLLPCVASPEAVSPLWRMPSWALNRVGLGLGLAAVVGGYAGTLWCYVSLGDSWRIGIDRKEKNVLVTCGPYSRVRHPIYLFQFVMLVGATILLPTLLALAILAIHLPCVLTKAADEEGYLLGLHGEAYRAYLARTGRLLPTLRARENGPAQDGPA